MFVCNSNETLVPLDVLIFTSKFYQQYSQYRVTCENFLEFFSVLSLILSLFTFVRALSFPFLARPSEGPGYLQLASKLSRHSYLLGVISSSVRTSPTPPRTMLCYFLFSETLNNSGTTLIRGRDSRKSTFLTIFLGKQ